MRGKIILLFFACMFALVPNVVGSASAGPVCEIAGGQATVSFVSVPNPVPFSPGTYEAIVGHAAPEVLGPGCHIASGVFEIDPGPDGANCVPDGYRSCTTTPFDAGFHSKFDPPFAIDVRIHVGGVSQAGVEQDTATCSMLVDRFDPSSMSCVLVG